MNIEDVKQIPIADYLHSLGYSPVKQQGNGLWYKSPLREEHEPSFKVNTDRNLWYDFGAGKGGNLIALAKELYCSDTGESSHSFHSHCDGMSSSFPYAGAHRR